MSYPYPPSHYITENHDVDAKSHFYCEGICIINKPEKTYRVPCKFEISYTYASQVAVVLYLDKKDYFQVVNDGNNANIFSFINRIIGRDIYNDLNIFSGITKIKKLTAFAPEDNIILIGETECFLANQYKDIANREFHISGIEFDSWHDKKRDSRNRKYIFKINNNFKLHLRVQKSSSHKKYESESVAALRLDSDSNFSSAKERLIVKFFCALLALSLGRDIQFVSSASINFPKSMYLFDLRGFYNQKTWYSRKIIQTNFLSLMSSYRDFDTEKTHVTENVLERIKIFISHCIRRVIETELSEELIEICIYIIQTYVNYVSANMKTSEGNVRLLSTLTEEFLLLWENSQNLSEDKLINRGERNKLVKLIGSYVRNNAGDFLQPENMNLIDLLATETEDLIRENIRGDSLRKRFERFFDSNGYSTQDNDLKKRISLFRKTRNSIAHTGRFAFDNPIMEFESKDYFHDDTALAKSDEINNVKMMIPLMIFTIFQYRGEYHDLIHREIREW